LVLWAAAIGAVAPVHFGGGQSTPLPEGTTAVVLLADPFSSAGSGWLDDLAGLEIAGTLVAPPRSAGGSLLAVNGHLQREGGVGFALGVSAGLRGVVCAGSRPIGPPVTVTRAEGALLYELDGVAARARLERMARHELPAGDIAFINRGLDLAVPVGGGHLLYPVAGADPRNGAVGLGPGMLDERFGVTEGTQVQFHVRDPSVEAADLARAVTVPPASAALMFPSSSPGVALPDALPGSATPIAGCRGLAALGAPSGSPAGEGAGPGLAIVHRACAAVACFYDRELGRASQPPQG
jgi:small ligand-binding sensory domain FIST